jgi:hypothetical protein
MNQFHSFADATAVGPHLQLLLIPLFVETASTKIELTSEVILEK